MHKGLRRDFALTRQLDFSAQYGILSVVFTDRYKGGMRDYEAVIYRDVSLCKRFEE